MLKNWMLATVILATISSYALAAPVVEFVTNKGNIQITLNEKAAPKTVANFMKYAKDGYYNGTIFHRVIDGFMVQGGGFTQNKNGDLTQKTPSYSPIQNEANNGLKNEIGTIAMARTQDPDSASSQFFINVANNGFLNFQSKSTQGWGYAVFGKVTKGMNVVESIAKTPTGYQSGMGDVPLKPIVIEKTIILKNN